MTKSWKCLGIGLHDFGWFTSGIQLQIDNRKTKDLCHQQLKHKAPKCRSAVLLRPALQASPISLSSSLVCSQLTRPLYSLTRHQTWPCGTLLCIKVHERRLKKCLKCLEIWHPPLTFWLSAAGPWIRPESLDPLLQIAQECYSPANRRSGSGAWESRSESPGSLRASTLGSPATRCLQWPASRCHEQGYLSPSAGQMTCSRVMMMNWQLKPCLNLHCPLSQISRSPCRRLWWRVNQCWWFVL